MENVGAGTGGVEGNDAGKEVGAGSWAPVGAGAGSIVGEGSGDADGAGVGLSTKSNDNCRPKSVGADVSVDAVVGCWVRA